jgi:tetratricopeptide (TPR) repeat protein
MYERALQMDPKNDLVLNNYSYSLAERGILLDRALAMSKEALSQQPENQSYLDTYGWIHYKMGDYKEAEKWIRKAIDLGSTSAVVHDHLGDVYFKKNEFVEAEQFYKTFLESTPDKDYTGIASYRLALCYEITGDSSNAIKYFGLSGKGNMDLEDDIYAKRKSRIYIKRPVTYKEIKLIENANLIEQAKYKAAFDSLSVMLDKIKSDTLSSEVNLYLSDAAYYIGKYDESVKFAVTAIKTKNEEEKWIAPFGCYYAARTLKKNGDLKEAELFVEQVENFSDYDYQNKLNNLLDSVLQKE